VAGIAINVAANTNLPGFRGPVWPDGSFEYIPIPEREPTRETVPTYDDLADHLRTPIPADISKTQVHLDPEFPEYPFCERYTYGDEHGVKAGPLSDLNVGDFVFFYATLSVEEAASWLPPDWGAFLIGHFRLDRPPLTAGEYGPDNLTDVFANNAHVKREEVDAEVLLAGDPAESRLYERAIPLSRPSGGTDAANVVTELSTDSGAGPWWRRPLRFDDTATESLLDFVRSETPSRWR
jgi:hypothetical protein